MAAVACVFQMLTASSITPAAGSTTSRPEVSIVVFDSQAAIGTGQGVYMPAVATLLKERETARVIGAFSRRSAAHGGPEWTSEDIRPGSGTSERRASPGANEMNAHPRGRHQGNGQEITHEPWAAPSAAGHEKISYRYPAALSKLNSVW
jgi:hypothetical protein